MLGWPVAGVAFLPLALLVLLSPRLARSFMLLTAVCAALLTAVATSDQYFYGRPTVRSYSGIRSKRYDMCELHICVLRPHQHASCVADALSPCHNAMSLAPTSCGAYRGSAGNR